MGTSTSSLGQLSCSTHLRVTGGTTSVCCCSVSCPLPDKLDQHLWCYWVGPLCFQSACLQDFGQLVQSLVMQPSIPGLCQCCLAARKMCCSLCSGSWRLSRSPQRCKFWGLWRVSYMTYEHPLSGCAFPFLLLAHSSAFMPLLFHLHNCRDHKVFPFLLCGFGSHHRCCLPSKIGPAWLQQSNSLLVSQSNDGLGYYLHHNTLMSCANLGLDVLTG